MFGVIDRYIGKTVLIFILLTAAVLTVITAIITFIDQTRHLGNGNIDFLFLLSYIALRTPTMLVMIFPVAVLIGGVVGLGLLSKNSELIVMQSTGMSKTAIILSSCKMIIPLVILVSLAGQTIVPELRQFAEDRFNYASSEGRVSRTGNGIWIREGDSFVFIRAVMSDSSIRDISRFDFDGTRLIRISNAQAGFYNAQDRKWDLRDISSRSFGDKKITLDSQESVQWELYLNPERLEIFNLKNDQLSVPELIDYIEYLESNSIDSQRYRTVLYQKFTLPLAMIVMLMLGASTVFGSLRSVPMSLRVLLGLSMGFSFYLCNEIVPGFTYLIGLPPAIGVLVPPAAFILLSLYLLNRKV